MKEVSVKILRTLLPFALSLFVLYWVYRDFDFGQLSTLLRQDMDWWWMLLSLLFGVLSHIVRGWRWKLLIEPLDATARTSDHVDAVYVSYAASLVIPRIGELTRCAMLARRSSLSFSKLLGTVVTERVVDALWSLLITLAVFALQLPMLVRFLHATGTKVSSLPHLLASPWFYVTLACILAFSVLLAFIIRRLRLTQRVRDTFGDLRQGLLTLTRLRNPWLFHLLSLLMWLCYVLHFYLTFYCFAFTAHLGLMAGLVAFVCGTIAVLVPTPNGAGPWHFAVITVLMLYGVAADDASSYALIVHTLQTLLVILLGLFGWLHMQLSRRA